MCDVVVSFYRTTPPGVRVFLVDSNPADGMRIAKGVRHGAEGWDDMLTSILNILPNWRRCEINEEGRKPLLYLTHVRSSCGRGVRRRTRHTRDVISSGVRLRPSLVVTTVIVSVV